MRTSLNDIKKAEQYLHTQLAPEEALLFEARLLTNPLLKLNLLFLKKVYSIVALYHRKKLKEEAEAVHQRLFNNPDKAAFRKEIYNLFNQ